MWKPCNFAMQKGGAADTLHAAVRILNQPQTVFSANDLKEPHE